MRASLRTVLLGTVLTLPALAMAGAQEETAAPPVAIAEEMDGPFFVTWVDASVRAAPDSTSEILEALPFGAQVTVTGRVEGGVWLRVQTPASRVGYVWAQVLAPLIVALPGQAPAAAPAEAASSTADDTIAGATPLGAIGATPVVVEGDVSQEDLRDYYSFTLTGWTSVVIDLDGMSADADLRILDADEAEVGASGMGGADPEHLETLLGPGTYYLEIYAFESGTHYRLSVSGTPAAEPPADTVGNTPDTAFDLGDVTGSGTSVSEWVGQGDTVDYYAFTLTERSSVTVVLDGLAADADLSLEDAVGTVLASATASGTETDTLTAAIEPGTYRIAVTSFEGATAYSLTLSAAAAGPAPADGAGNTPDTARPITLGADSTGLSDWIGIGDSDDYYAFSLTAPGEVTVVLTLATGDADLDLMSGDGTTSLGSSQNVDTEPERVQLQLDAGSYLVRVYAFQGDTDYTLDVLPPATR